MTAVQGSPASARRTWASAAGLSASTSKMEHPTVSCGGCPRRVRPGPAEKVTTPAASTAVSATGAWASTVWTSSGTASAGTARSGATSVLRALGQAAGVGLDIGEAEAEVALGCAVGRGDLAAVQRAQQRALAQAQPRGGLARAE